MCKNNDFCTDPLNVRYERTLTRSKAGYWRSDGRTISFYRQDGLARILAPLSAVPPKPSTIRMSRNFRFRDPDIRMASGAVIAVAMTLNELCTNTTKFGALSVPKGRVDIACALDPQTQRLHLARSAKNGPAAHPPEKRSFGTRLIETLGKQLKGDVRLTYEPTGLVYTFDVSIASLTSPAA